jgi:hypothetical protein
MNNAGAKRLGYVDVETLHLSNRGRPESLRPSRSILGSTFG